MSKSFEFLEFFAGGGLARKGLGDGWNCVFANDICLKKASAYLSNFPSTNFKIGDVNKLDPRLIPNATLAWASFPCQDLSLAGNGKGINGDRSGAFWGFWNIIQEKSKTKNRIPIIALENVVGLITSNSGSDFKALVKTIVDSNYRVGAFVLDAVKFVPQSRPRLFFVCIDKDLDLDKTTLSVGPIDEFHVSSLQKAVDSLDDFSKENWIWWNVPSPAIRKQSLNSIIKDSHFENKWHTSLQTALIVKMMSKVNKDKLNKAKSLGKRIVGTLYRRTRVEGGTRVQRWEVRFDGVSGCLRTPAGGSSRQVVMVVKGESIKTRLIAKNEIAALMGLNSSYKLPQNYNEAYHLLGDAVAVPAIDWIARTILCKVAQSTLESQLSEIA